jgi:hypothetical protein
VAESILLSEHLWTHIELSEISAAMKSDEIIAFDPFSVAEIAGSIDKEEEERVADSLELLSAHGAGKEAFTAEMLEHFEALRRDQADQEQYHHIVLRGERVFHDVYGFFAPIDGGEGD